MRRMKLLQGPQGIRGTQGCGLISAEQAVALGCAIALVATALFAVPEPTAVQPPIRCAATIAQYGPGERWGPLPPQLPTEAVGCLAVLGIPPNHILTSPMGEK